jgi:hypothetical protein
LINVRLLKRVSSQSAAAYARVPRESAIFPRKMVLFADARGTIVRGFGSPSRDRSEGAELSAEPERAQSE